MQRMPDPAYERTDVTMLWDFDDEEQWIDLRPHKGDNTDVKGYAIPTSFFQQPGNEAFAWGTIALVGCTMMIIVKTPTPQDPRSGVYMAHIWEYVLRLIIHGRH